MTIERRSPLPVGTYWQDLIGDRAVIWHAAVRGLNSDGPMVRVLTTETFPAEGDAPKREWIRYKVLAPVVWDHVLLGSPTVSTEDVQTSEDTVVKPDVPGPIDTLTSPFAGLATPAKVLVWSLVGLTVAGGVTLIFRIAKPRRRR